MAISKPNSVPSTTAPQAIGTSTSSGAINKLSSDFAKLLLQKQDDPVDDERSNSVDNPLYGAPVVIQNTPSPVSVGEGADDTVGAAQTTTPRVAGDTAAAPAVYDLTTLLSQTDAVNVSLRLTQGPLAGLILEASMKNGRLELKLNAQDRRRFEKIEPQHSMLMTLFGNALDMPLTLEIHHADSVSH
ncbi:MAG: hypothetical protein IT497_03635 [Ottowia sp.]|nr:hypothetical protein [Ottowia sp.]